MGGSAPVDRRLAYEATVLTSTTTLRAAIKNPQIDLPSAFQGMLHAKILRRGVTLGTALEAVSTWMLHNYRTEAVYKRAIVDRYVFSRSNWPAITVLNEFRVGRSVADLVVVDRQPVAFEIKTELDYPSRLFNQIAEYATVFDAVNLVTHRSIGSAYLKLLAEAPVGLITLMEDGSLRTRRRAPEHNDSLSVEAMFKALRKSEYTAITESIAGGRIDAPPTQHFRSNLAIAESRSSREFKKSFDQALATRGHHALPRIAAPRYRAIRAQLLRINPSTRQLDNLDQWLRRKI